MRGIVSAALMAMRMRSGVGSTSFDDEGLLDGIMSSAVLMLLAVIVRALET